jgi:hypothetical protein
MSGITSAINAVGEDGEADSGAVTFKTIVKSFIYGLMKGVGEGAREAFPALQNALDVHLYNPIELMVGEFERKINALVSGTDAVTSNGVQIQAGTDNIFVRMVKGLWEGVGDIAGYITGELDSRIRFPMTNAINNFMLNLKASLFGTAPVSSGGVVIQGGTAGPLSFSGENPILKAVKEFFDFDMPTFDIPTPEINAPDWTAITDGIFENVPESLKLAAKGEWMAALRALPFGPGGEDFDPNAMVGSSRPAPPGRDTSDIFPNGAPNGTDGPQPAPVDDPEEVGLRWMGGAAGIARATGAIVAAFGSSMAGRSGEILASLDGLFGGGEDSARRAGETAGNAYRSGFEAFVTGLQNRAPGSDQKDTTGGAAAHLGGGGAQGVAAQKPMVMPAPDLTEYAAGLAQAVTAAQVALGAIGVLLQQFSVTMGAAAASATTSFNSGLLSGFATALGIVSSFMAGLAGLVAGYSLFGPGLSIGSSLGQGIAVGIASSVAVVQAAAAAVVHAAAASAAQAAISRSPSLLFAREIGGPISEGIAVGIADKAYLAAIAASDAVKSAASSASAAIGTRRTSAAVATQRRGSGSATGGRVTNVFPLKTDEYGRLIEQAQRGNAAFAFVDALPRAYSMVRGG